MTAPSSVLCLNSGSSSLKFACYEFDRTERVLVSGAVEGLDTANGRLWVRDASNHHCLDELGTFADTSAAIAAAFAAVKTVAPNALVPERTWQGQPLGDLRHSTMKRGIEAGDMRHYKEQGTITTPFDMVALNDLDRFHLVIDAVDRVESLRTAAAGVRQAMLDKLEAHRRYIRRHGEDLPDIREWRWECA